MAQPLCRLPTTTRFRNMRNMRRESMTVAFFPASYDQSHASSRIRALSIGRWLEESGNCPISWHDARADTAVVFKRPEMVAALAGAGKKIIFDISDDYTWSEKHVSAYREASVVVAGTTVLAQRLRLHNENVVCIPDCIDRVSWINGKWRGQWWQEDKRHLLWFGCWGNKHHAAGGMRDIDRKSV